MNPCPFPRVWQEGRGVLMNKNVYTLLSRFSVGPIEHRSSMSLQISSTSFNSDFFSYFFILKRRYHKYSFYFICFLFSLSPWIIVVFSEQRANRSIRKTSYHWPQGTSAPAEAGLLGEIHRRLDTFHWRLAAEWAAGSLSLPPTTENTAGPPAHSVREMVEQPEGPHGAFHWNQAAPWITSWLATEPAAANKIARCK